jgi:hypothetical protein
MNNMRQIGIAVAAYRCNYDNKFPPWISSLHPGYLPDTDI